MENYKVYVEVTVKFSTDGVMMPVEFIWEDGTKYIIDKVNQKNDVRVVRQVVLESCIRYW